MASNRGIGRRRPLITRLLSVLACFAVATLVIVVGQRFGSDETPAEHGSAAPQVAAGARPPAPADGPSATADASSATAEPSASAAPHRLGPCARTLALARRMGTSFDIGQRRVDVLGDSYSVGTTLTEPRTQTWDVLVAQSLGWRLTVRGIGRTGFVNGGSCGRNDYQTRVGQVLADRPQLVVVQGGLNDVGYVDRVWRAASRLLSSIPSGIEVVVIGPPAAPAFHYSAEQRVDDTLRAAVASAHGTYVSTLDWPLTFATDGIHLDENGNKVFAEHLATAIGAGA